ncbi:MAG: ATP-binding protein [Sandaracinaceae bacterium]|nr:ATP-binding protein [Sandaracinaceae bacterium]
MDQLRLEQRYDEARQALLVEFATRWTRKKPLLMSVQRVMILLVYLVAGYETARLIGLVALFVVMTVTETVEAAHISASSAERVVKVGTALSLSLAGLGCAFTGGFASLILPGLLVAVVVPAAAFGRRAPTWVLLAELVILMVALLALPPIITGPALPKPWIQIGIAASITFSVWVSVTNIVALTDISQRAAVMAAQMRDQILVHHSERARTLETMGAKVAHEIKNPLAAIAGLVQLLLEGPHDAKTRERLGVIASEVDRTERVLREYLAFSRPLDALRPLETDLGALVDDVLALLEARARKRGVILERSGIDARATVDPRRIKEALFNLVDNAVEASSARARVTVELAHAEHGVSITVRDEGPGIAPELLPRVGTPFFTTRESGTGLGIVIARAAVSQHGGSLSIDSCCGKGTTARIVLPGEGGTRAA